MEFFCKYARDIGVLGIEDSLSISKGEDIQDLNDSISLHEKDYWIQPRGSSKYGIKENNLNLQEINQQTGMGSFFKYVSMDRSSQSIQSVNSLKSKRDRKSLKQVQGVGLTNVHLHKREKSEALKKNHNLRRSHSSSTLQTRSNERFDNLYKEALKKQEKQILQETLKLEQENERCSFHPKLSSSSMKYNSEKLITPVYDRLSKQAKLKQQKIGINKMIKEKHEMAECSFKPQINDDRQSNRLSHSRSQNDSSFSRKNQTFNRLYNDAEIKNRKLNTFKMLKDQAEQQAFSFSPQIISPSKQLQENYLNVPVGDRLYNDYFDQITHKYQRQIVKDQEELKDCTFTPQINSPAPVPMEDETVYDRLYSQGLLKDQKNLNKFLEADQPPKSLINSNSVKILNNKKNSNQLEHSTSYVENFAHETKYYDRLFNENEKQQRRKKILSNNVLKEAGVTFKPEINKSKKQRRSIKLNGDSMVSSPFNGRPSKDLSARTYETTYPRSDMNDIVTDLFRPSVLSKVAKTWK